MTVSKGVDTSEIVPQANADLDRKVATACNRRCECQECPTYVMLLLWCLWRWRMTAWATACECRLVCSVTGVDIIPGTRDGMSAATVGLRTSGTGQHRSRHRTQTSVISNQPPESGGTSQGCGVTLVRTLEASIKTLWLRIRRNKHLIKPRKSNCSYLVLMLVQSWIFLFIHSSSHQTHYGHLGDHANDRESGQRWFIYWLLTTIIFIGIEWCGGHSKLWILLISPASSLYGVATGHSPQSRPH